MPKRWVIAPRLPDEHLAHFSPLPPLVVQLLYNRGVREPGHVTRFLQCQPLHDTDPFQLKGMERAVSGSMINSRR
ncbi:MAG: hypothetical protein RMK79_01070 [Anaerolineae bacterium]|nr:hypothetical protein [Anaerolineae bacterium]